MGNIVLILGETGSGKTSSLRNFKEDEAAVFSIASKKLPFRNNLRVINGNDYAVIKKGLSSDKFNCYIIDDSQYLLAFEQLAKLDETGYKKHVEMANNFYKLLKHAIDNTPDDVIVYFLHHPETTELGKIKAKTIGKMIDNWLTLEGLFTIVLMAKTDGENYVFETNNNGNSTCKSPFEMFESKEIPNDLKAVDGIIREYWGLNPIKTTTGEKRND